MTLLRIACRTCGREIVADDEKPLPEAFPFCSPRCRLVDVGKWADGEYRVAGKPVAPPPSQDS